MKPIKYTKKPVIIEAIKFTYNKEGITALRSFCGNAVGTIKKERHLNAVAEACILTLEDGSNGEAQHIASEGDYVIKGVKGEFYPCKPNIFKMTYEKCNNIKLTESK